MCSSIQFHGRRRLLYTYHRTLLQNTHVYFLLFFTSFLLPLSLLITFLPTPKVNKVSSKENLWLLPRLGRCLQNPPWGDHKSLSPLRDPVSLSGNGVKGFRTHFSLSGGLTYEQRNPEQWQRFSKDYLPNLLSFNNRMCGSQIFRFKFHVVATKEDSRHSYADKVRREDGGPSES